MQTLGLDLDGISGSDGRGVYPQTAGPISKRQNLQWPSLSGRNVIRQAAHRGLYREQDLIRPAVPVWDLTRTGLLFAHIWLSVWGGAPVQMNHIKITNMVMMPRLINLCQLFEAYHLGRKFPSVSVTTLWVKWSCFSAGSWQPISHDYIAGLPRSLK